MTLRDKIAEAVLAYRTGNNGLTAIETSDAILDVIREGVKPLDWLDGVCIVASPEPYQVWADNGGSGAPDDPLVVYDNYMLFDPYMIPLGQFKTFEEAKAAAQADYTRRILSALGIDQ